MNIVLTNTELPSEPYPLADFAKKEFSCTIVVPPPPNHTSGTVLTFYGIIDSFYTIPEPGSLALLAMAALVMRTRRGR